MGVALLAALLAAATPHQPAVQAKYALVIGISDYLHYGDEPGGDLPGATNDAIAFREVLVGRLGVPAANIHMVVDLEATRARIEREMSQWLPSVVRPGDLVWIFYAGHGSQAWDQDADEADGLDETICPTDVGRTRPSGDIRDDDLDRWLSALPAAEVILVWDKCHAESSMRAVTPFARSRVLGRDVHDMPRPTGLRLPPREARTTRGLGARPAPAEPLRASEEWLSERTRTRARDEARPLLIEIAASEADQVAMDAAWPREGGGPPVFGGAFTTNFVRNIWQAPLDATIEEIFEHTANDLRAQRFEQRPTLTDDGGLASRSIAALSSTAPAPPPVAAAEPAAEPQPTPEITPPAAQPAPAGTGAAATFAAGSLPVISALGGQVALGGGAAAGVTVGSVYSAGGRVLRVTEVSATGSSARFADHELRVPVSAARGDVDAGMAASLLAYAFPTSALPVSIADLPTSAQEAIVRALGGWPSLALVRTPGEYAHLIVRPTGDGYVLLGLDGFPRHRIAAATPAAGIDRLRDILTGEARAHQLASLDNPARPFPLEFSLSGDDSDLIIGEYARLHVRSGRGGYLTLIDLPADGSVYVLFPQAGQDSRVEAGAPFTLPRAGEPAFRVTPPAGRSMVRAFVTERPLEITLEPGDPRLGEHVLAALRRAAGESPLRDSDAVPVDGWATASIVYDVRE